MLDRDGHVRPRHHGAERRYEITFAADRIRRGLQDEPGCALAFGMVDQPVPLVLVSPTDRDRHRHTASHAVQRQMNQVQLFCSAQFHDFGGQPQHGQARRLEHKTSLDLCPHRGIIDAVVAGEIAVQDRVDAGESRRILQGDVPFLVICSASQLRQFDGHTQLDVRQHVIKLRVVAHFAPVLELRLELAQVRNGHDARQQRCLQPVQPIKQIVPAFDLPLLALGRILMGLQFQKAIHRHCRGHAGHGFRHDLRSIQRKARTGTLRRARGCGRGALDLGSRINREHTPPCRQHG